MFPTVDIHVEIIICIIPNEMGKEVKNCYIPYLLKMLLFLKEMK